MYTIFYYGKPYSYRTNFLFAGFGSYGLFGVFHFHVVANSNSNSTRLRSLIAA
jgi:hypothetical protein